MKTITTNVYSFDELSNEAQQKAIEHFEHINVEYYEWWNDTYEDAANIGLKINEFDIDRGSYLNGKFTLSANEVCANIFTQHGEQCKTYILAESFMDEWKPIFSEYLNEDSQHYESRESEEKLMNLEQQFLSDLCEEYLTILRNEYEYITSKPAIMETIIANDYQFTQDGKLF